MHMRVYGCGKQTGTTAQTEVRHELLTKPQWRVRHLCRPAACIYTADISMYMCAGRLLKHVAHFTGALGSGPIGTLWCVLVATSAPFFDLILLVLPRFNK